MRTNVILGSALLALLSLSPPADALKTSVVYKVSIDGSSAGYWVPRGSVQDLGFACRYSIRWRGVCTIDEYKVGSSFDCRAAGRRYIATGINKPEGEPCTGEDESGQRSSVMLLNGAETSGGRIRGMVQIASVGDVQSIYIRPR